MTGFDPYAAGFVADPYPTYGRLRTSAPMVYDESWGLTFFTRHRDVSAILRDRRFGRTPAMPSRRVRSTRRSTPGSIRPDTRPGPG